MSDVNTLTTRSSGQEKLKEEWNTLKANKAEKEKALRLAKMEKPQDTQKIQNAKADLVQANDAIKQQRQKEKEFNSNEKARILGGDQTKKDTLENPTDPNASVAENTDKTTQDNTQENKPESENKPSKKGFELSQGFYSAAVGAIRGTNRNLEDEKAATAKEQAQNARNETAEHNMEAQRAQQIANQNPYAEAGKIASMQNDAENRQRVATAGVLGAGAALARKTNTPDVQSQIAREDQQQSVANQRREMAQVSQSENTAKEGDARQFNIKSREFDEDKTESAQLSMGEPGTEDTGNAETEPETEPENTEPENTNTEPESEPETEPQAEPEPQSEAMPSGNPQHVINWLLGSSKGRDIAPQKGAEGDNGLAAWVQEKYNVQPLTPDEKGNAGVNQWEGIFNEKGDNYKQAMQALRQGRAGAGNDASRNFNANEMDQMNKNMTVESDERIKNIMTSLSDARCKRILASVEAGNDITPEDFMFLAAVTGGKFNHDGREYDFFNDDDWADDDGSVLDGYGEYIRNYLYTYKPEATQIDSDIDPNQEHIGPMAQDIEKVNPACIKETPEGIKTVDTARLAMMNAGAIGDIARELQDLKARLSALGV